VINKISCYLITIFFGLCTVNLNAEIVNIALQKQGSTQTVTAEWVQHAHDAQHTGYTDQVVETPWRWKWSWNGPNSTGGISNGKTILGRITQPVTGNGRVYIPRGYDFYSYWTGQQTRIDGVYALDEASGQVLWSVNPGGNIITTAAYDYNGDILYVVSTNGRLYKLNASNGTTIGSFNAGSAITVPPCLISDRVFISAGNNVFAVNKTNMTQIWIYNAGSPIHTPPAYSPSRNCVIVGTYDLNVHCINNTDGTQKWKVKPTVCQPGNPESSTNNNYAEYLHGWPVIAEIHGLVLMKVKLDWNSLYGVWSPWPTDNATMRTNLQNTPDQQALFALDLDDGTVPFICNIGHGGWGDGCCLPMGSQPIVKKFPDNKEVVYMIIRGHVMYDGRWDSHFGEMVLDNTTVSGYQAGYVRFIRNEYPPGSSSNTQYFLTDEQPYISMAGDYLFGTHWEAAVLSCKITDRSDSLGSWNNKIATVLCPTVVTSQDNTGCAFSSSHYCSGGLQNTRGYNYGFYIYYGQGGVYDNYWSEYGCVVTSNGTIYVRSCDGAIVALEHGSP